MIVRTLDLLAVVVCFSLIISPTHGLSDYFATIVTHHCYPRNREAMASPMFSYRPAFIAPSRHRFGTATPLWSFRTCGCPHRIRRGQVGCAGYQKYTTGAGIIYGIYNWNWLNMLTLNAHILCLLDAYTLYFEILRPSFATLPKKPSILRLSIGHLTIHFQINLATFPVAQRWLRCGGIWNSRAWNSLASWPLRVSSLYLWRRVAWCHGDMVMPWGGVHGATV